ncbi:MAG TPA: ROK family protein [bacterium]|nr:ROK family protein [bacterium]
MPYENDDRIVMSLDAGGTNFVFIAMQANEEIVDPVTLPSHATDLERCLNTLREGFTRIREAITGNPVAISFAFPGPADFPRGIIGDLVNLPAFRGGVPLGPMLEREFDLPVFINNDGDLFAYGESIAGFLPYVNSLLAEAGDPRRYTNLFGVTLGTGFGAGIVRENTLFLGDNSCSAEIWLIRSKVDPTTCAEEQASIRGVRRFYAQQAGLPFERAPSPRDIYDIALGEKEGNREAARAAYRLMGEVVGDALANCITLIDGLIVIGGGLAGAHSLFLDTAVAEMNGAMQSPEGDVLPRLDLRTYNLEDADDRKAFLRGEHRDVPIPGTSDTIQYDPEKRIGVGLSRLGTSKAMAVGAYAYALHALDR